jgi:hypothetical protein
VKVAESMAPTRLRPAALRDYERIAGLARAHGLDVPVFEDWSGLWRDNPVRTRRGKDYPIGWVLETERGEMVGCMGTVHAPYTFRGQDLTAAVARAWFVYPSYRPMALELMDAYLNQPGVDLVLNNAVSAPAHDAFAQFCSPVPLGRWDRISYWVTRHPTLAKELPRSTSSPTIEAVDRFDSRFDTFWKELRRQNPDVLLADRSADVLSWHFAAPMRKGRLWTFTASRGGNLRAYCTLTRQDHAFRLPALPYGDTQLPGMRLVDYQSIEPEIDFLPDFLRAALERCRSEDLDILEMLGRGVPKMRVVDECAPHCEELENWKFYYRAADAALDGELRRPERWDPSGYDGDVSFE